VTRKARLGLYLEDEEVKKQIKVAAARRGTTATDYCTQAIEERLIRDGERKARGEDESKAAFLSRMDEFRQKIGPIGASTTEIIEEGRRR